MTIHVPPSWERLAEDLAATSWRRLVVLGATDVGKSTFCRFLGAYLLDRDHRVGLLDTDLGQKMAGPPACVTLANFTAPDLLDLERIRFVGEVSSAANIAGVVAASARLTGTFGGNRLIVNTDGLITGPGVGLKRWQLDALAPDRILAICRGSELQPVLESVLAIKVDRIELSELVRRKSPAAREQNRRSALTRALGDCRPVQVPGVIVEDLHRTAPFAEQLRLCGLADCEGEDRGIGLVRWSDFVGRAELWTNLDPAIIKRVRLGAALSTLGAVPGPFHVQPQLAPAAISSGISRRSSSIVVRASR